MTSGIYLITSQSNKVYVGSSKHIEKRFAEHRSLLVNNKHHCRALQNAWNKYNNLNFVLIEYCEIDKLLEREQFWLDNCLNLFVGRYNSSGIAGRIEMTDEVRRKQSIGNCGQKRSQETKDRIAASKRGKPMGKRVYSEATMEKFRQSAAHARAAKLLNPAALARDKETIKIAQQVKSSDPKHMVAGLNNLRKGREILAMKRASK